MATFRRSSGLPGTYGVFLALTALSFVVFSPALFGDFVSDDLNAITRNEYVVGPFDAYRIFTEMSWWGAERADSPGYRPLTTASFALTHALVGDRPAAYHATNLMLHGLVSWLVFVLAQGLAMTRRAALAGAGAFCLLPIHTEAVAWIVGRAELLAAAGFAAALVLLLDYRRRGHSRSLAGAALLLLAALLAKENAATLLAAPVLLAWLLPGPKAARRRDLAALAALACTLALYLALRVSIGELAPAAARDLLDNPLSVLELHRRLAGALAVLGRYLWLTLWPAPLSVDYSYNALGIAEGFVADRYSALAVLCCAGLGGVAWHQRRRDPAVTFAIALAAASYSIVSNTVVLIGTVMGERLFYLPTLGLCLALGPALEALIGRLASAGIGAIAAGAVLWAGLAMRQASVWSSAVALFENAVAAQPTSARARMELASAYGHAGRSEDAVAQFGAAVKIMPTYAAAWYNLGNLHARQQRLDEAASAYQHALEHSPALAQAWFNLALTRQLQGRLAEAETAYGEAAVLAPRDPTTLSSHGDVLLALGRNEEAEAAYTAALAAGAPAAVALVNRGVAKQRRLGCDAALPDYLAALSSAPASNTTVANATACLAAVGRWAEADALRAAAAAGVANPQPGR